MTPTRLLLLVAAASLWAASPAVGQMPRPGYRPTAPPRAKPRVPAPSPSPAAKPMRKASELISKQQPMSVNRSAYESLAPSESMVLISLSKQRAYLLSGDKPALETPISSGKRAGSTPTGRFNVMEKDKDHRSNLYGDFRDRQGRVVRGGVSVRIDSAPSGTRFVGAPMKWFMRLTGDGVGMHVGILPGYPASHGCVRLPEEAAAMIYQKVQVGTPVQIIP